MPQGKSEQGAEGVGMAVRDLIRARYDDLTLSERQLADALLENYPGAGLASITVVAARAGVSTPTVTRMLQKLGLGGFAQFQALLLAELEEQTRGPKQRREQWAPAAPDSHLLSRFSHAMTGNLARTFEHLDTGDFDAAVSRLSDVDRRLYVVGGRITRALADYAFTHFQAIRRRVTHMTSSSATWPHYVIDMEEGDTLLMFDVRRYETNLERLARLAMERGVEVILITDQWSSPVSRKARYSFSCWTEVPSAWDSNITTMMMLEALIAATQERNREETGERFDRLDALFDLTRLFRK